ncbi:PstS family phosphate ABC transporter substrate-binding protein [Halopseudomonas bauzanensis]|uniref:Phosphate-binding protein n=1 Tax=Halopseudomonas bauzanensis TaxID=653930 RepID=A0A031MFI6_9GAMM|nr:phosphate ABC transporter substrate-binding protein PstS family protein [Halopseudomonas bauzanensis]EZQ18168.1 phosphate-binding protein [Halopseudomonas bauzanensis]TKA92940.1 phosphate ABC transporter substrate-binding protein PstS family protein [Halopseudomonas bauzanensis]SER84221.1 phosphate ABC transporter substrate-binding protein, PhoT family [Halopseudomonas bauzanensis]SFL95722.1 phosphate transport system substrate-binding protein [Halopseudomonas bauzanensis]
MKMKRLCAAITVAAAGMAAGTSFANVDADLKAYERVGGVSGNLSSVGSDSLANMMTLWAEEFKRHYPNVNVQIQAAGSSTAPPALTEGTSSLAPMSRKMKDSELQAFEEKYGYKPVEIPVAIDALAVFAHKDNPIEGLTMAQLDAVFSSTRLCGNDSDITTWGQAGLDGQWANRDIQLYGRNSVSGTYGYFKEVALCKGDFKSGVNEQPGSASVVQSISQSLNAIGYSGIGYRTSSVRTVPLAAEEGAEFVDATPENAVSGEYPLSRFLYVYVNKAPNKELAPLEREFVKLMLSKEGQEVVFKDGYVPMPKRVVDKVYKELDM